ncbi:phosphoglycerate dehydrogenase [Alicyclobacillus cycloheptanicus]|uniref:D-3-phosphoglycerate dehydrogenase n=1 Tax=Alicyclobacillus cycloheptanicus TaxID=1457 RepID=A0ABT9XGW7_9BACL|nr:phosphoglycerate dehydrogenase [Alicyclobacillus cycloheptanicus]MDQ0189548.1 D-3-phosphoglycerate dehydrogenase [Alicyclobacillus cycloheptanicus]WDM01603.1 phosphoglycerate dehydrogenase [Alicyclobacillus cycloheptanicus]
MKILVADDISQFGIEKLQNLPDSQVRVRTGMSEAELMEEIADTEALLVRSQTKVTAAVLEAAKHLKVIGRAGVGVDNIDVPAATRRGIVVINAPDGNTISAAEHTFAMLITLSRHIPQADRSIREGRWDRKSFVGVELRGKTLAVLGTGRIGTEVAKRAKVFGMTVMGYDPYLTEARAKELGIIHATFDEAIEAADFITVHTPLTKETRHLLNAQAFARMKDGVRIINCARGGIIDEEALAEALQAGKVAGAAIDVFEQEPIPADHPLIALKNVVLTPHLGASTVEAQENVAIDVAEQVGYLLQGLPFKNAVNLPSLSGEQKAILQPYLALGEQLGLLAGQWVGGAVSEVEIGFAGPIAEHDISYVTRTVLKGWFSVKYGDDANYVNAPFLAEQTGITVREVKQPRGKVFTNLLTLTVKSDQGEHRVAGTLYNGFGPRIVEIDGYTVDAAPQGNMLMTRHVDKPGMIGKIGSLLGDAGVNIAAMQVGRRETGGEAVMVLSVDKAIPEAVLTEISKMDGIVLARAIDL